MIGGLFAGTEESPGEVELYQGALLQVLPRHGLARRHGASGTARPTAISRTPAAELEKLVPEGIEGRVPYKGSLVVDPAPARRRPARRDGLHRLRATSSEMRTRPEFVRITSAGVRESHVHDVTITKEAPNYRVLLKAARGRRRPASAALPDIHADRVLILDFGSQYTQLIARRVRELGVYCEIHPWDMSDADGARLRRRAASSSPAAPSR